MRTPGLFVSGGMERIVHVLGLLGQGDVSQLDLIWLWACVPPFREICPRRRPGEVSGIDSMTGHKSLLTMKLVCYPIASQPNRVSAKRVAGAHVL